MITDIDPDKVIQPISRRERLAIKLVLLLVGLIFPAKYGHQMDKLFDTIREELK